VAVPFITGAIEKRPLTEARWSESVKTSNIYRTITAVKAVNSEPQERLRIDGNIQEP
jgi:hypothetical protein